jgi:hypothetical protein
MALQIPAWDKSSVRKDGVDAGLRLRRIKDEFGLAVFLLNRVVTVYRELAEGLAIGRDAITEANIVHGVADQPGTEDSRKRDEEQSF